MSSFIKNGKLYIEAEPLSETMNAHDLGIAGGYIIEQTMGECIERLKDENAKLLELVKGMRVCLEDECKRCHEWGGDICDLEHQMRELGIEVD